MRASLPTTHADGTGKRPMLKHQAIWNGTDAESYDLLASVQRHCACEFDNAGARTKTCTPHHALVYNQRFLDGVLFARRIAQRLIAEEWACAADQTVRR
jgi:hypothetical protein